MSRRSPSTAAPEGRFRDRSFVLAALAFILLTPPLRAVIAERVLSRVRVMDATAGIYGGRPDRGPAPGPGPGGPYASNPGGPRPGQPGGTLEGEFERLDDPPK